MYTPRLEPSRRIPIALVWCLACGVVSSTPRPGSTVPEIRVAIRSGDPAPGAARLAGDVQSVTASPGGLLFIDGAGTALFRKSGEAIEVLAYSGQTTAGGRTIGSLVRVAAGGDGTIAVLALLADRNQGILRVTPGGGPPEEVVLSNESLDLRDGPATVGYVYDPVVEPDGTVLAAAGFLEVPAALVRFRRGSAPQVVIQSGDPLGPGSFVAPIAAPAVNGQGRIVLGAGLDTGDTVIATIDPGQTPVVLTLLPPPFLQTDPTLANLPPSINDTGQVAFLLVDRGALKVREISDGFGFTVVARGAAAPGGGTFSDIADFPPVIDAAGRVLFAATRSNGRHGFYLASSPITRLAEEGMPAGDAGSVTGIPTVPGITPVASLGQDGVLHFAAGATTASGIFSSTGTIAVAEVRSGDPVPGPRFASFLDARVPFQGGGPSLAPGGLMIFDATVTGGSRGLFARDRSGAITSVVIDGDPAPGGGTFDGRYFSFHSINDSGTFAFLGCGPCSAGPTIALYYGDLHGAALRRVAVTESATGVGPGYGGHGLADRLRAAPSRINRLGQIAVPVSQADGTTVLLGFDGTSLFRIAGPGDPAPGGDTFTTAFTGSLFTGLPVPPVVTDGGAVLFGAQTAAGDSAIFSARLMPAGGGVPVRLLGQGDEVPGGRLSPFEIQALDRDASGAIAFQSVYNEDFYFADFVKGAGPAIRVAARLDPIFESGQILAVMPSMAFVSEGTLAYGVGLFDGRSVIVVGEPGGGEPLAVAATGETSPDGGVYLSFQSADAFFSQRPGRLASDGRGSLALSAATTRGPEEIVLIGRANEAPAADAGPDQTVECAAPAGALVTLDGRGSSDPEGASLRYHWTWAGGQAEGPGPSVMLPLGVTPITLIVDDGELGSSPDTVNVEVRDTTPPTVIALADRGVLWPPDGRLAGVSFDVAARDLCDPSPAIMLVSVTSSEPVGGKSWPQYAGAQFGTDDRALSLRADRSGSGPGRTYLITYRATDRSGNFSDAGATVFVPHDQRH